ncbi:OmpA family protein [Gayadomonas joobiniege]|uniref:OmpA family protein n=1 Tax=Gayadomonas joobiniege TaxID=1234606 RepID=UPI0003821677|nr:OmpA family protein [Gayadomonas joobiniege]
MTKMFKLASLTTALICSTYANAEAPVYVTGGASAFFFDTDVHNVDNGAVGPWVGLGYQIDKNWAVELDYNWSETETDTPSQFDTDVSLLSLNGLYRYAPVGQNSWIAKAGLGQYTLDADTLGEEEKFALKAGAGYEHYFTSNLSATFFYELVASFDSTVIESLPSIGLKYQFGQTTSKSDDMTKVDNSNAMADADKDGVADSKDMCSNTPTGVRVNSQGCPFDRDSDGVYDYKDECPMTPNGVAVDSKGCRKEEPKTVSVELYVQFELESAVVKQRFHGDIKQLADFMKKYPNSKVVLVGHADSTGPADFNQRLSEQRAQSVADYMVKEFNVSSSRITTRGEGERNPIADNSTREGRAKNRRVTTTLEAQSK